MTVYRDLHKAIKLLELFTNKNLDITISLITFAY